MAGLAHTDGFPAITPEPCKSFQISYMLESLVVSSRRAVVMPYLTWEVAIPPSSCLLAQHTDRPMAYNVIDRTFLLGRSTRVAFTKTPPRLSSSSLVSAL